MNSRERLLNRLKGLPVDRLPNMNILMTFSAYKKGVPYGEYATDYKKLVECDFEMCSKFGIDLLCSISDPAREAEGMGCGVTIPQDDVPHVSGCFVKDISDAYKIKVISASSSKRMMDRINSVAYFKKLGGKDFAVSGWVEGAFAECCDMRGINDFMMDVLSDDDEDAVVELLEKCYAQSLDFALCQIQAGADIVGVGDAAASLISEDTYEKYALPYQIRLIEQIHKAGAKAKLHICGNITRHLSMITKTKADIVDIDWMNDFKNAVTVLDAKQMCANGNYDPVAILLQGSEKTVENAVFMCASSAGKFGAISAGCEVPKFTPDENLLRAHLALKAFKG